MIAEVDCYFGDTSEMVGLKIGDRYPWRERAEPQNGGRPESGTAEGEGYMECPQCHKDAFMDVLVREGVIIGVKPNQDKQGYVPD